MEILFDKTDARWVAAKEDLKGIIKEEIFSLNYDDLTLTTTKAVTFLGQLLKLEKVVVAISGGAKVSVGELCEYEILRKKFRRLVSLPPLRVIYTF